MRWLIVGMLAMLGCDRVFGLELRDADPVEMPPDATMTTVVSLELPTSIAVGESATITARLAGVPDATVTCTFSAMRGSFAGSDVQVTLDGAGMADAIVQYTAPATGGEDTIRASVSPSTMSKTLTVRASIVLGNESTLGGMVSVYNSGTMLGTRIVVTRPLTVTQIGVWMGMLQAGTRVRLGLYNESLNLVGETTAFAVTNGRNAYPLVIGQDLAPGTYWIVSAFTTQAQLHSQPGASGESYTSSTVVDVDQPLPAVRPTGSALALRYAQFLIGLD